MACRTAREAHQTLGSTKIRHTAVPSAFPHSLGQKRKFHLMRPFRLVVLYALLAPPLGGLLFWGFEFLPPLASAVLDGRMDDRLLAAMTKVALMHAVFSYLLGLLPAVCAGIAHALLRRGSLQHMLRIVSVGFVGFCSTAALLSIAGWRLAGDMALPMLFAGTCVAALLAWMVERVDMRPRRPTPMTVS